MNMDGHLLHDEASEKELQRCIIGCPDRAPEIVGLVEPCQFFNELHQKTWRAFKTQLAIAGEVDVVAVARKLGCVEYFNELSADYVTTVHAEMWAERVCEKYRARALDEILCKAIARNRRGLPVDSTVAQTQMALGALEETVFA